MTGMTDEHGLSDKAALSPEPRVTTRSDEDIAEAIDRMIAALGRRCAQADPDTARLLQMLQQTLDTAFAEAVAGWRAAGTTDTQIGSELGVTKQAVQQRWPR